MNRIAGDKQMSIDNDLKQLYTFAEAAKLYGLADASTLRKAVQNGRFNEDEIKKIGTTWIVTKAGMDRLYSKETKKDIAQRIVDAKKKASEQGKNPGDPSKTKNTPVK